MLPSALALIAVAAVVLLLMGVFGTGDDPVASPTAPATTPSPTPSVSTSIAATTTPTAVVPSSASTGATFTGALTPPPVPTEFPDIDTVVLNSTDEAGLAGRVSTYLGELGWTVGPVGNFEAPLALTTVYYPEGYEDAARALAAATPSPSAVASLVEGVGADSLTVVLGADAVEWLPADEPDDPVEPTVSTTP